MQGVSVKDIAKLLEVLSSTTSNSSCTIVHELPAETTNSQFLFEKRLQQQSSPRSILQGGTKLMDIKPETVTWEVSNFLQSNASETG